MSLNLVVEYDDNITAAAHGLDATLDALRKDYVENHENEKLWERVAYKVLYKAVWRAWRFLGRRGEARAIRHVEYDGKRYDIDWKNMTLAEIEHAIEKSDLVDKKTISCYTSI